MYDYERKNQKKKSTVKCKKNVSSKEVTNIKPPHSVVQLCNRCRRCGKTFISCDCDNGFSENRKIERVLDPTFTIKKRQALNPSVLRRNLRTGNGGEAHHIIPGNVVEKMRLDKLHLNFDGAWNGIMLNGTYDDSGNPVNEYPGRKSNVYHRKNGQRCHSQYDLNVMSLISRRRFLTGGRFTDLKFVASNIKRTICNTAVETTDKTALDDLAL